ncbi:tyrosine-type recombinase/integrase [Pseudofulvibacter geojedonensis]|uniref:Tyrosine-type recombinase/integrase n=1 Tax=Pseudofulvibacter geojedonensis TaxID=1123758 RepID=A0ABW3I059_9FLAO
MKSLPIYNNSFRALIDSYQSWLTAERYAATTVYYMPIHLREFFHYLETLGHEGIEYITTKLVSEYYEQLSIRKNQKRGGALSNKALNKHIQSLKLFVEYLNKHDANFSFGVHLKSEKVDNLTTKDILSVAQIEQLFEACEYSHISAKYRLRDMALLTVLYSCGLRRNEAVQLDVNDVKFNKNLIHVRHAKKSKERFVVINDRNKRILEDYLYEARPQFGISKKSKALFVNQYGRRMSGQTFSNRLKSILKSTEDKNITSKHVTPHTLRHCIATHFLQSGMKLKKIQKFLGHASIEATQIYTHLLTELEDDD